MNQVIITQTPRLFLRQVGASDFDAMCRILCDPEVMLFSMGVLKPADVGDWIECCIKVYSTQGFGIWSVVEKDSREVIGYCGLTKLPNIDGQSEIEIGFRLARAFWSQGYATECTTSVRDYAFETLSIPRLIALVDPENAASIRVAEKLGMTYEKDVILPAYDHPDCLYAVRRPDTNR